MTPENSNNPLDADEIMRMTTDIVASFVANNPVPTDSLPDLIASVHKTVTGLSAQDTTPAQERPKPAVPISRSITEDHIICLEDGKKFKSLKRHLPGRRQKTENAETLSAVSLWHDAGRVPQALGTASRLSDGRTKLHQKAFGFCKADRTR